MFIIVKPFSYWDGNDWHHSMDNAHSFKTLEDAEEFAKSLTQPTIVHKLVAVSTKAPLNKE